MCSTQQESCGEWDREGQAVTCLPQSWVQTEENAEGGPGFQAGDGPGINPGTEQTLEKKGRTRASHT